MRLGRRGFPGCLSGARRPYARRPPTGSGFFDVTNCARQRWLSTTTTAAATTTMPPDGSAAPGAVVGAAVDAAAAAAKGTSWRRRRDGRTDVTAAPSERRERDPPPFLNAEGASSSKKKQKQKQQQQQQRQTKKKDVADRGPSASASSTVSSHDLVRIMRSPEGGALTAYLSAEGYLGQVLEELARKGVSPAMVYGRLVVTFAPPVEPCWWAATVWYDCEVAEAPSIRAAAEALRARSGVWGPCYLPEKAGQQQQQQQQQQHLAGRAQLVRRRLPFVSAKRLRFPFLENHHIAKKLPALGAWTLLEGGVLLAAARTASPFPGGAALFEEDKAAPPNRAYLKVWEALALWGRLPDPGDFCVDLGAAPGGWTWAMAALGCRVLAVDRAPLDLPPCKAIEAVQRDAFDLDPASLSSSSSNGPDWLLCDVVCYPDRLLGLLQTWAPHVRKCILATLKFQGRTDFDAIDALQRAFPDARIAHLHQNKHELTFFLEVDKRGAPPPSEKAHGDGQTTTAHPP